MPEVEFHFLFDREWSEKFLYSQNVIPHKLSPQARHPILWHWWFEKSVVKWLKANPVDLFLSLDSFLSLNTETKTFLVMHDLAFEHFPEHVPFLVRKYYQYFFPKYAKKANKIFAVSKFTKQDIVSKYQIEEEKIEIAYCGVSDVYKPLDKAEQSQIKNKITNGNPYFICIGSLNPRKNIQKVVQAFNKLKSNEEQIVANYKLLIVGAKGWKTSSLYEEISSSDYKKDIILLGHLKPRQLAKYLASAQALVFPSLFEGFGIPIIEAFKCEVPVITSNLSSTKEIGEKVSLLINPFKIDEIQQAMLQIVKEESLRTRLITQASEKVKQYTWANSTDKFYKAILNHINSGH